MEALLRHVSRLVIKRRVLNSVVPATSYEQDHRSSRLYTEDGSVGVTGTLKGRFDKGEEHKLG